MKRQYAEIVTCVSLVAYAVIVVAGQAAHFIPGLGCQCHSVWRPSQDAWTTHHASIVNEHLLLGMQTGQQPQEERAAATSPFENNETIASNDDCPICHWLSLAQQPVELIGFDAATQAVRSSFTIVQLLHPRSLHSGLARGPPLRTI